MLRSLGASTRIIATDHSQAAAAATRETLKNHEVPVLGINAWWSWFGAGGLQLSMSANTRIIATDHSQAAAAITRETLQNQELMGGEQRHGHSGGALYEAVFNPPYVPTPDEEIEMGGIATAWAGGYKGRRVIDRLLPQLADILSDKGELFMVTVSENEPHVIIQEMSEKGFIGSVVMSRQADEESLTIVHLKRT
eukprot:gene29020-32217_t